MNPWAGLLLCWLMAAISMSLGWWWQYRHRNIGIVDVLWGLGLGLSAQLLAAWCGGAAAPRIALALAGGVWALRLSLHIWRRMRGQPEDGRYLYLRKHWHGSQWKLFGFFQLQALLVALFALPFVAVASNPLVYRPWLALGCLIWLISVAGEAMADWQLERFRRLHANKGKTCRDGLWRYSRHPNYFFEWLQWFAYVCFAVGSPLAWLAWSGPLVMWLFLRYISGIPWTEAQAVRSRGDDYLAYQRSTPMLFPWFPKREHNIRSST